jgi:hypothetical protein
MLKLQAIGNTEGYYHREVVGMWLSFEQNALMPFASTDFVKNHGLLSSISYAIGNHNRQNKTQGLLQSQFTLGNAYHSFMNKQ